MNESRPAGTGDVDVTYAARNVINFGAGIRQRFSRDFSLFASYRLDHTTTPPGSGNRLSLTSWDLHHVTGGASFMAFGVEFTAGVQYSQGRDSSGLRFEDVIGGDVIAARDAGTLTFRRIKVLLGFNLPLGKQDN